MRNTASAVLFCVLSVSVLAAAGCAKKPLAVQELVVTRADGTQARFTAELAMTPADRQHGLMERQTLAADHAMLFVFPGDEKYSFWMKNTPIFLDMLFIDRAGQVVHVHSKARPFDETAIATPVAARYVLEIKGGEADAQHIHSGDRLAALDTTTPSGASVPAARE